MTNYRNRALLDLAHTAPCMLKVEGVCNPSMPSVPAHSNLQRHGRGVAYKSHDCFVVAACPGCHEWLDTGRASRMDKDVALIKALDAYVLWLWRENKIKVA